MDYTKSERRVLKKLLAEAHSRELTKALEHLYGEFQRWESGDIDCLELDETIHHYHQNEARVIWSHHNGGLPPLMVITVTVQSGLMNLEEVPVAFRERVAKTLQALSVP